MRMPEVEKNALEVILARRSVRHFTKQEVDRETVKLLLEAAVRAPTAEHREPWAFVVVQDPKLLLYLSEIAKPLVAEEVRGFRLERTQQIVDMVLRPDFNIFYDAPTLIVICARNNEQFSDADCWLAAENLMLAACAVGLGSCVIGSVLPALNTDEIKTRLNISYEFHPVAPVIVGYPQDLVAPATRKEPQILSYISAPSVRKTSILDA
jgi:nitroreductase